MIYSARAEGRFYAPPVPDPSSVGGDIVDSENPQAWNMYSYVLNNPLNSVDLDGLDYWLIGGGQCGQNNVQCDKQGFVLDNNGNRVVVTDEQINGSNGLAKVDENGNLQITTAQGTFQGQFFDPNIDANGKATVPQAIVTPSFEEQKFMALQDAGAMATPGVNAALAITAPQMIFMAGTSVALSGASETTIFTPSEGQTAHVGRILAQGGKRALRSSIRSWRRSVAEHMAKLEQYRNAGTPTSDIIRTINNLKGLIEAAQNLLGK